MKQMLMGVVLLVLLGIAGFFYRNTLQTPGPITACPMDAMVCPDGSSVGRIGPACAFAPCPTNSFNADTLPVPEGYTENPNPNVDRAAGGDMTIVREFTKPSASPSVSHIIRVQHLGVSAEGVEADIVRATRLQPSDMPAESIDQFEKVSIGGHTFYSIVIERFEAQVESAYYLPIGGDLYRFTIIERDVTDWMEPTLSVKNLPEHAALLKVLAKIP